MMAAPSKWLDEVMTGVLAAPFIAAFTPAQDFVSRGFDILATHAPGWYLAALGVAVAYPYGKRALPPMVDRLAQAKPSP